MRPEEMESAWARFLAGEKLSPDDERLLAQALQDLALRDQMLQDLKTESLLHRLEAESESGDDLVREFLGRLHSEGDATRFIDKVKAAPKPSTRRRVQGRQGAPNRFPFVLLAAAAALFMAILLTLSLVTSEPEPGIVKAPRNGRPQKPPEANRIQAEEDRKAAEANLQEAERKLREAEEARKRAEEARQEEDRRKADEAFRAMLAERKALEEKLRAAREREEKSKAAPLLVPAPAPEKKPIVPTEAAIARITKVEGEPLVAGKPAVPGQDLLSTETIETKDARSFVEFRYPDDTRIEVEAGTVLRDLKAEGGKRFVLEKGWIRAVVAKQPKGQPLVVETPTGEATVLGTTLRIKVEPDPKKGTRLDVEEGRVQLKNRISGKTVDVLADHYAVAAAGLDTVVRPTPINDIILIARQGKIAGDDWKPVADAGASAGWALDAPRTSTFQESLDRMEKRQLGYVEFTFDADAGKDYALYVRAACSGMRTIDYDAVAVYCPAGTYAKPTGLFGGARSDIVLFTGYFQRAGYFWGVEKETLAGGKVNTIEIPVVRFPRSGSQILRCFPMESPIRIDAIWLSATQKTRPAVDAPVPRWGDK